MIILAAWKIWKHCNDYVFNGATPSVSVVSKTVQSEKFMVLNRARAQLHSRSLTQGGYSFLFFFFYVCCCASPSGDKYVDVFLGVDQF